MVTYKLTCNVCGKSYQTDKRRGERISKLLKVNPSYLADYRCSACIVKSEKSVETPTVKEVTIKVSKTEPTVVEEKQVEVDIELQAYIPKSAEKYYNRTFGKVKDEDIMMFHYQSKNPLMKNVLFIGETSTGKSALVRYFCWKNKIPYYRVVLNAGTTVEDIIGQNVMDETGKFVFTYQVLIKFMQKGGVFVFDEINAGQKEILHILNSITDWERKAIITQHKGEVVQASENFLVVACMNPPEEYDLQDLSKSLMSRFTPYYFDYDEKIDAKIIKDDKLLEFAKAVRKARVNNQIETPLGTRDLVQYQCLKEGLNNDVAKEMLINKFKNGEKDVIRTMIETHLEKSSILNKKKDEADQNANIN